MSTAMNPADRARFLLALRDDLDFRDEVRNLLLGDELLQLPERFAQFAAYVNDFIEEQKAFNSRVDHFIGDQQAINTRVDALITEQKQFNEDQRAINRRVERDLGILKGNAARRLLQLHHDTILEIFKLDFVRTLGRDDLSRMVRELRHRHPDRIRATAQFLRRRPGARRHRCRRRHPLRGRRGVVHRRPPRHGPSPTKRRIPHQVHRMHRAPHGGQRVQRPRSTRTGGRRRHRLVPVGRKGTRSGLTGLFVGAVSACTGGQRHADTAVH